MSGGPMMQQQFFQSPDHGAPPPGSRYQDSYTNPQTGAIVDRFVIAQRGSVPVRQVVPEVENYQIERQVQIPDTRQIQVPMQRMVPQEETVMVPRIKMVPVQEMVPQTVTKMVPEQYMATQTINTTKTVNVTQPMQRTISKVIEGQKIVEQPKLIEYERPRVIPGRVLGERLMGTTDVGVQWTGSYYENAVNLQREIPAQIQYVTQPQVQYVTQPQVQYVTQPYSQQQHVRYVTANSAQPVTMMRGSVPPAQVQGIRQAVNEADFENTYTTYGYSTAQQGAPAGTVI